MYIAGCLIGQTISDDPVQYKYDQTVLKARKPDHPIHPLLLSRSSARAMTGEPISDPELFALFEAARWAPSAFNIQPWRFVYAKRDTPRFAQLFNALQAANQVWVKNASALVVQLSAKYESYHGNISAVEYNYFDAASAFLSMELEASARGLVAHPMALFDYDQVFKVLGASKTAYNMEIMIAVGKRFPDDGHRPAEIITTRVPITNLHSLFEILVLCLSVLVGLVIGSPLVKIEDDHYDPYPMKFNQIYQRKFEDEIHPLLSSRTSQKEMTGAAIPDNDIHKIFEAARWAPSSQNIQPWRFVYAKHGTPRFAELLATLVPSNQVWAKNASVIVYVFGANWETYKGKVLPVTMNQFDSGSAFMSLSLEANGRGYVSHAIGGVDYEAAYKALGVTKSSHTVHVAVALGVPPVTRAAPEVISTRNPSKQFVFEDKFVNTDPDAPPTA
ncbi:unnamed protein product [Medioppia subpectinata]|uniref:Nitroreductase domain-containing protein n=1 Tax=Medioppia subpectinata TaxID=1979941 RepID=A0A7R9KY90_9ACAR|nr:unnamed protein product [Medioppia subpectinata]CAG2111737.1 unnamed protein product [Medioppia subpectinata]